MKVTDKYVFFWGSIYSQWAMIPIQVDSRIYNCNEQYMMHRKALLFEDFETAKLIMETQTPKEQKELGRKVLKFDIDKWNGIARDVVYQANLAKFTQHSELLKILLQTEDRIIVEASPFDSIWGIGMRQDDKGIENPENWKGKNWLGEAIMKVREEIRKSKK